VKEVKKAAEKLIAANPKRPDNLRLLARVCEQEGWVNSFTGRYQGAAAAYTERNSLIPNYPQDDYILCALLVLAGDTEGYRKCRTKMFRKFADLNDPDVDWRLARAYVIAPGGGADPAIGLPLIERAVRSNPNAAWYLHVLGLAQYRAGHFAETIKQLNHSIE